MQKILLSLLTIAIISSTQAAYTVKIHLPDYNISMTGSNESDGNSGEEVDEGNGEESDEPIECEENGETDVEICNPETNSWAKYAADNGLSNNWGFLYWGGEVTSPLPVEAYPIRNIGELYLYESNLTNLEFLSNVTSIGSLHVGKNSLNNLNGLRNVSSISSLSANNNALTDVSGLSRITGMASLTLTNNQLTNVNGLSNLRNIVSLSLNGNNLSNLSGIANLQVSNAISIDKTYSGAKLAANTIFCTYNDESRFPAVRAQKSQICESN